MEAALIESCAVRARPVLRLTLRAIALSPLTVLLVQGVAAAQVQVTPNFSQTPQRDTGGWTFGVAYLAAGLGVLILLGIAVSYVRFAPRFFGREEAPRRLPPGVRPQLLARQPAMAAAAAGATRPASAVPAGAATRPAPHAAQGQASPPKEEAKEAPAPAKEEPVSAEATEPEGEDAAAEASTAPTAGPGGEPAVQADAVGEAEAAAPESRPSAKTPEETGQAETTTAGAASGAARGADTETPAGDAASVAQAPAGADQATFDRVLKEQLDKGVNPKVAEGRARAAAVVAGKRKSEG